MKTKNDEPFLRRVGREAKRQIRGFPDEFRGQVTRGWGQEFAHQILWIPRHRRRRLSR